MKPVTDDDLVLLYYGEHDDPGLAARVARDPALSARLDALAETLALLDAAPVPEPAPDLGLRTWQQIVPRLARETPSAGRPRWLSWLSWLAAPRLSFGGLAVLLLVATFSFWLGRQAEPAGALIDAERLLEARVAEHLADADVLLTHLANGGAAGEREAGLAGALLVSNRIYRHAAATAGKPTVAALLAAVERPLTDIANAPSLGTVIDESLLFQVRSQARRTFPGRAAAISIYPDSTEEVPHDRQI